MVAIPELNHDAWEEKHVPIITPSDIGIKISIGSVAHPMEDDHYIEWIELISNHGIYRKYLHPHEKAEAEFFVKNNENLVARAYCNLHGLWSSK